MVLNHVTVTVTVARAGLEGSTAGGGAGRTPAAQVGPGPVTIGRRRQLDDDQCRARAASGSHHPAGRDVTVPSRTPTEAQAGRERLHASVPRAPKSGPGRPARALSRSAAAGSTGMTG